MQNAQGKMHNAGMTRSFLFDQPAYRVIFGAGSIAQLPAEVNRLGAQRVLIVSTAAERAMAEDVARPLGARAAGFFDDAVMHHPIETVQAARDRARAVTPTAA